MKKAATFRTLAIVAVLAMVLVLLPIAAAPAAELDWTREATDGITNPDNYHLAPGAVFRGKLMIYAANFLGMPMPPTTSGASIYQYDGTDFTQVADDGFGDPNNTGLQPTAVYQDQLFIGTANGTTGAELFRWNGVGEPLLVPNSNDGWGEGAGNDTIVPQGTVDGKLVVTVANRTGPGTGGLRVYEQDGATWTQLVGPAGTLMNAGFGDSNNTDAAPGVIYDGRLILPVANLVTGMEVWSYDGTTFSLEGGPGTEWTANETAGFAVVSPSEDLLYLGTNDFGGGVGGQLWSWDGATWNNIEPGGIENVNDQFIQPFEWQGGLYASVINMVDGCRVYKRVGTDWTPLAERGFGGSATNVGAFTTAYEGKMVSCTLAMTAGPAFPGGQVWTTPVLSQRWFFAEGTTRDNAADGSFDQWVCIQNPGPNDADVNITYMLGDGSTEAQNVPVPHESRLTVSVNDAIGKNKDVSTMVESDWPVLVERPMYFDYRNKWSGGHIVMGVESPRMDWFFAEGTTRDNPVDGSFEEWLCIQNPGPNPVDVDVTYMLETGQTTVKTYQVDATSRETIDVNRAVGPDHDVSMLVHCDKPIVAERPMYFDYHGKWRGGHDVVGAPGPATEFYFAEGTTRDNPADGSFEEWICIQNPGPAAATVDITYWTSQAGTQKQKVVVGGSSRSTVDVKLKLGADVDTSFKIESDLPVLVERPMYFNYHSVWDGGHNVMGCAGPRKSFYFAEGTTLTDFNTYIAVLNPGDKTAEVTFTYMIEGEANEERTVMINPEKRYTQNVASEIGINKNVSILVESDRPIVAERPMYFGYHGKWAGGHDTLGLGI
jgi:hypothetical protein